MLIQNGYTIKITWILLDTCSTYIVTNNLDYVEDTNNCAKQEELIVLTDKTSLLFNRKGRLPFLPFNVHMNENSLLTILF